MKEKEAAIKKMGGDNRVAKQHAKGKLSARERLDLLFDKGTFREIDMFVKHRCTNFGMEKVDIPSDGVVTPITSILYLGKYCFNKIVISSSSSIINILIIFFLSF